MFIVAILSVKLTYCVIIGHTYEHYFCENYFCIVIITDGILCHQIIVKILGLKKNNETVEYYKALAKRYTLSLSLFLSLEISFILVTGNYELWFTIQPGLFLFVLISALYIIQFKEENLFLSNIIQIEVYHKNSQMICNIPINEDYYMALKLDSITEEQSKSDNAILLAAISVTQELDKPYEILKFNYGRYYKHVFVDNEFRLIFVIYSVPYYLPFERALFKYFVKRIHAEYREVFMEYYNLEKKIPPSEMPDIGKIIMDAIYGKDMVVQEKKQKKIIKDTKRKEFMTKISEKIKKQRKEE